ncbi:MAG: PD-(D/E)XK nuclease family protein, partial [Tissierellia bacterium]|nr:PD-(D/E)XK nuclease family protein [Tissierellia bacterium]
MSVKIIAGRANTGKSCYIYDKIKKEAYENPKCNLILIVPELMTYQAECDIIEKYNLSGIMNVEILSFNRLQSKILGEVGGLKVQNINVFGKIMLLKQIFEENKDSLQVFRNSYKRSGFLKEFNELITEFKQNLVSSNLLKEALNKVENELLKKKLLDIELIYNKFYEKTYDQFFDEEDKTDLFISLIKDSKYLQNSKIWIDGFESFNYQRLKLIKNLYDSSKSLTITLNIDSSYLENLEKNDDWEAFKIIYDTFLSLNRFLYGDIEIVSINKNKIPIPEIREIERNLFSLNIDSFEENTENIVIYSSLNQYSETQKTAAKIISLVRDYGYRWRDIKVAVGSMDNYEINIKRVFTQYKIPFFLDTKRDIMNNPLTKYILSILDMVIYKFKHDNVFDYFKTGFSPLKLSQINCLENYALQYGIEGEKWFKEFKLYEDKNKEDDLKFEIEECRKLFADDFIDERKIVDRLKTTSDITRFIFKFIEKHNVYEKIQQTVIEFNNNKQYEEASEYSQVWNHVMEIFEQLLIVGEETKITVKEYRKMLESGLNEVRVGIIPPAIDKVEIGDVDRIAVGKPKVLFVLGANDSNLDVKNNEKGLLLNDERELLLQNDVKLTKGSDYDSFKDKHMLYKLFSCPTERLYVSYALGKTSGESLQPSMYIDILKKIFISIKEESDLSDVNQLDLISNYSGTYDYFVENMRDFIDGYNINNIWKDVYTWYEERDKENFSIINKAFKYNNFTKQLESDNIQKIYKDNMTMTVSKLESYAECQFKYFLENVLKPKPRLIQKIEFYDLGNIYHSVVERLVNKISEEYEDINDLNKTKAEEIVEGITNSVLIEQSEKVTA